MELRNISYVIMFRVVSPNGVIFHQAIHMGPSLKKKKKSFSHTIYDHKTPRSYLNELETFKSTPFQSRTLFEVGLPS